MTHTKQPPENPGRFNPKADMVIVRFASTPQAANAANDPTSLPAYQAVADYLMAHDRASAADRR